MADSKSKKDGGRTPVHLEISMKSVTANKRGISVLLKLHNPADRALHYVSEVRGLKYEPASKTLTVIMSDEGRVLVPGPMEKEPVTRSIDPKADAELELQLPPTIVKLAETPSPQGALRFEEQAISEAEHIDVRMAWSDTPYYIDPRPGDPMRTGLQRWQRDIAHVSHRMRPAG